MTHPKPSNTVPRVCSAILLALAFSFLATRTLAQGHKDCDAIVKEIDGLTYQLETASTELRETEDELKNAPTAYSRKKYQEAIESHKSQIRSIRHHILTLLDKLCACCGKKSAGTAAVPTPSTTDRVTDVLKTIGSSVSIGIGGGHTSGHDEHHHGEDRHRTADKVSTDKTKKDKASPTTTHKTVTSPV